MAHTMERREVGRGEEEEREGREEEMTKANSIRGKEKKERDRM